MNAIHIYSEKYLFVFVEWNAESFIQRNYLKYFASGVHNNKANLNTKMELIINCEKENEMRCI